jgi:hypothetical protein
MLVRSFARAVAGIAVVATLMLAAGAPAQAAPPRRDTTPPTRPTSFRVTEVTHTSVSFAWNRSTDNVGVTQYTLWGDGLDGVVGLPPDRTTGTISGLRPGQTYTFHVRAWDWYLNGSPDGGPLTVTTRADTTAPSVPTGLAVRGVRGSSVDLFWNASTDDVSPADQLISYEILVNGVVTPNATPGVAPGTRPAPSAFISSVRQLEPGTTYQFAVRAVDGSGNRSATSTSVTATTEPSTDTTPPTTPRLLRASDGGTSVCPEELIVDFTGSTDDATTPVEYEVRINGAINDLLPGPGRWVVYTEVRGANTVTVVAVDRAGNASAPSNAITANIQWGLDCGYWLPPELRD